MSILKFEPRTPRSLEDMVLYLKDERKTTADGLFGIGCNPSYAVLEMEFVQRIFFQEQLAHPYLQVIFAFDVGIKFSLQLIRVISQEIGQALILDSRQVFGAIHYLDKPDKIHCHYLINYVGIDGNLYRQNYSLRHYKVEVNMILNFYGLNQIKIFNGDEHLVPVLYAR